MDNNFLAPASLCDADDVPEIIDRGAWKKDLTSALRDRIHEFEQYLND